MRALGESGVDRLDVLAVGGLRDEAVLRELTTGNLEHDGQRIDGAAPLTEIARRLVADVTTGYGPECFAVQSPRVAPYRLRVHYYRRGPMGYGMGPCRSSSTTEKGRSRSNRGRSW